MTKSNLVRRFVMDVLRRKGDGGALADNDSLVLSGRLASIDLLEVVTFLEEEFGLDLADRGFDQRDFDSIESIVHML